MTPRRTRSALQLALVLVLAAAAFGCARGRERPEASVPNIWPVGLEGRIVTSPYGDRTHPNTGRRRFHKGVDLGAPHKSPVVATAAGVVVCVDREPKGYGRYVVIDHGNGFETCYAHLHRVKTAPGKRVRQGAVIGLVGTTGNATGPHLHYEVRRNGRPIDPMPYLP